MTNWKQKSPVVAIFVTDRDEMSNLYRGPYIDVSYQVSIHLTKRFQRRRFLEMYQSETRIACGGDVYSQNQDEMGNLYRGPSIDASYQVSFHLAMRFQRRFFRNRPIRNRQVELIRQVTF